MCDQRRSPRTPVKVFCWLDICFSFDLWSVDLIVDHRPGTNIAELVCDNVWVLQIHPQLADHSCYNNTFIDPAECDIDVIPCPEQSMSLPWLCSLS